MTKASKVILAFSVVSIAFSFTEIGSHVYFGIVRPIGAVTFIVFFIMNMLAREMTWFDEDHAGQSDEKNGQNATRPATRTLPSLKTTH